ncbi:MAG TPA: MdtA/MuxA family multidrug efflux RND transporter periplasmic adaptor subunit [Candidatus Binataceae bacterium]|nr:MdtA/MuxA family multidrug efflux RND transporter periplasmic adaptor subunit [Candidatus Binataceae bacterium]
MNLDTPPTERQSTELDRPVTMSRRWFWLVLIIMIASGGYVVFNRIDGRAPAAETSASAHQASIPVEVATARTGDLNHYITALGTVSAFYTVTLKTRIAGEIMQVLFKEGQLVKKGQLLIQIDPRPYQVQLEQAQGQMAKDLAALQEARLDLERYRVLLNQQVIAHQQYDQQAATAKEDAATIISDQAAIDTAKLDLIYCRITAPISGKIGLRLTDPGNYVQPTDATGLAVITQLQPIAVIFTIPEDSLEQVIAAMHSDNSLVVDAYDRSFQSLISSGALTTLDNQIDQTTGTVKLKAVFNNLDYKLFPNQFVNVRMLTSVDRDAVLIPVAALQRNPQGTFVYIVRPDHSVETRSVTPGSTQGGLVAIGKGLNAGEMVVTNGIDRLHQGSKIVLQMAQNTAPGNTP